jgi:hypothetical protein
MYIAESCFWLGIIVLFGSPVVAMVFTCLVGIAVKWIVFKGGEGSGRAVWRGVYDLSQSRAVNSKIWAYALSLSTVSVRTVGHPENARSCFR